MTPAVIWFGWWLCFNNNATFSSSMQCIPMKSLEACQASGIQHGPSAFGFEVQKIRQQFCINSETGERK